MLLHTWLPATLRGAGLKVVETSGWRTRSHGQLPPLVKVIWHHDASPPGNSPGALNWMINNWANSSAQIWVDNYGVWHLVGTGVAWHAGRVKSGMPDNFDSIGIETDQTTNEPWPAAQLASLRRGTAAIFAKQQVSSSWLHFHKTICTPTGRKQDPYGLDLGAERSTVGKLIGSPGSAPPAATAPKPPTTAPKPPSTPTPPKDTNDMADITKAQMDQIADAVIKKLEAKLFRSNNVDVDANNKPFEKAKDQNLFATLASANTNTSRIYLGKSVK